MRYKLITKELVHLLEGLTLRLGEEEPIASECNDVEDKEDVEVLELDRAQCLRGELGEDQIDSPVGEGCNGVTERADFDGEDLDNMLANSCLMPQCVVLTSAGYTHEMIPSGV